jgi:hypothetical protein
MRLTLECHLLYTEINNQTHARRTRFPARKMGVPGPKKAQNRDIVPQKNKDPPETITGTGTTTSQNDIYIQTLSHRPINVIMIIAVTHDAPNVPFGTPHVT